METEEVKLVGEKDLGQRLGRVRLSHEFLRTPSLGCLKILFMNFYPVQIVNTFYPTSVEYLGMSPHFDVVPEGTIPPEYQYYFKRWITDDGIEMVTLADVKKLEQFERVGYAYEVILAPDGNTGGK